MLIFNKKSISSHIAIFFCLILVTDILAIGSGARTCTNSKCASKTTGTATATTGGSTGGAPTSTSGSSSGGTGTAGSVITGNATYYTFYNSSLGSCGIALSTITGSMGSMIVALPPDYMKANCGMCVNVTYQGKTIKVNVTDTCADCASTHIDLSDVAFQQLAAESVGNIPITWQIVPC